MPRACKGLAADPVVPCIFGKGERPAQPKPGNPRCSWCDPALLLEVCDKEQGRKRLQQLYQAFTPEVAAQARNRLPQKVRWSFPPPEPDPPVATENAPQPEQEEKQPAEDRAHPAQKPVRQPQDLAEEDEQRHALPEQPATHANLSRCADFAEAEAALQAHAAAVRPSLRPRWIAGDGNCLYRAVATQLPQGLGYHSDLRQLSTAAAVDRQLHYAQFCVEQTVQAVCAWAET